MQQQAIILSLIILAGICSSIDPANAAEVSSKIPCSAIEKVDFNNAQLEVHGAGNLKFINGKACLSEDIESSSCDWENIMMKDDLLNPAENRRVRMLTVKSNHTTGSGAWDHILVFECMGGYVEKIFERKYLYGATIDHQLNHELVITSGIWLKSDPMCCPSQRKRELFHWEQEKNTYVLSKEEILRREK